MRADFLTAKLELLKLQKTSENEFKWCAYHTTFGEIKQTSSRNIFSKVAMSAFSLTVTLRAQELSLQDSIKWGDKQLYITGIDRISDRHSITVTAVNIKPCTVFQQVKSYKLNELNNPVPNGKVTSRFPAWITEKYVKYSQADPFAGLSDALVLIVPEVVPDIPVGDVILVDDKKYVVEIQHLLDPDRNEYEIVRRRDA